MPTVHGDAWNLAVTLPWHAHLASALGAGHGRDGRPNQDAVGQELAARPDGSPVQVVAIADGHGDARHFRSDRGARMAVAVGIAAVLDWSPAIAGDTAGITSSAEQALIPDIVARWNTAVATDISEDPFSEAERALHADLGLASETAYGSTLLIAAFTAEYVIFAQIGDGDIVGVLPDGRPLSPVPQDSSLDGRRTTSLCQPDAAAAFRTGVIQLSACSLYAVLAATDGFGNAQADDPWQPGVAADLARFGREHDQGWLAQQVPGWAAQCASSDGSGDDTTLALVVNSAIAHGPGRPPGQDMLADHAVPVRTLQLPPPDAGLSAGEELPGGGAGRDDVQEPARLGRTVRLRTLNRAQLTMAVAVAAAVIVGLVLALLLPGHGQSRPKPGRHPAHKATHQPSPPSSGSATPSPSASVTPSQSGSASPSPSGSAKPGPSGSAKASPSGGAKASPSGGAKASPSGGAKASPSPARNTGSPHASGPRPTRWADENLMIELQTGDRVRMQSAGETLLVGKRIAEGGEGVVFLADMNGQPFAVKWYRPLRSRRMNELRAGNLVSLVRRGRPRSSAFLWPIDMVDSPGRDGFGYVMPFKDDRFVSFVQLLKAPEPPGFHALIEIGINLADAFEALHANGLCYRDISFGNLFVDPATADIAIIDNDNIGPSGGQSVIRGTPQFMAPEVIREENPPSTETDLYSLAVFLFYLFCFGHPLEGAAVEASYSWEDGRRLSEQELMIKHFGREPIFVFDPDNDSNRPSSDGSVGNWWGIYPDFFRNLFIKSFTTGLYDPTLTGRLVESVWRKGLYRLADCRWQCDNCQAAMFFDPGDPGHRCWACGGIPSPPLLLTMPGHALVLTPGAVLTGRHLKRPAAGQQLAEVEIDPRYPGAVMLRNLTDEAWTVQPAGEEAKQVRPRQRLLARPMTIELAGKQAAIQHAPGGRGER